MPGPRGVGDMILSASPTGGMNQALIQDRYSALASEFILHACHVLSPHIPASQMALPHPSATPSRRRSGASRSHAPRTSCCSLPRLAPSTAQFEGQWRGSLGSIIDRAFRFDSLRWRQKQPSSGKRADLFGATEPAPKFSTFIKARQWESIFQRSRSRSRSWSRSR